VPDGRVNSTPVWGKESQKPQRNSIISYIYLYNTYEACIQSPQTSCQRGLANPFPSSSPKASKERSFESPFVNMGFSGKEDDAVFATLIKDLTRGYNGGFTKEDLSIAFISHKKRAQQLPNVREDRAIKFPHASRLSSSYLRKQN